MSLSISEDAFEGDAQYLVSVDGVPEQETFATGALRSVGQYETLNIKGNFAAGSTHVVSISFINGAYAGSGEDCNLYVNGATLNGTAVANSALDLLSDGTQSITFGPATAPASVTVGQGFDDLALSVSENAYRGDAQFTVTVDGQQVGGALTTTASQATGQTQTFNI